MNTSPPVRPDRSAAKVEGLLLLLLLASLIQIGACFHAGCRLVQADDSAPAVFPAPPVLGTNAPIMGGGRLAPAQKFPGFQSGATRS